VHPLVLSLSWWCLAFVCWHPIPCCLRGLCLGYLRQTGAGKTFTMIGDTRNFKFRGVAPRAIAQVFSDIGEHPEKEYNVAVSYMEIYNERIFDLLAAGGSTEAVDFQVVEDRVKGTSVRGSCPVHTTHPPAHWAWGMWLQAGW
jgi:hypothetical protein